MLRFSQAAALGQNPVAAPLSTWNFGVQVAEVLGTALPVVAVAVLSVGGLLQQARLQARFPSPSVQEEMGVLRPTATDLMAVAQSLAPFYLLVAVAVGIRQQLAVAVADG